MSHAMMLEGSDHEPVSRPSELPVTLAGRAAMWLALAFSVGFIINMPLVAIFGRIDTPEWLRLILPAWGVTLMIAGVGAGVTAAYAALRNRERSWGVMIALLPGAFAIMFVLGEFLVPH